MNSSFSVSDLGGHSPLDLGTPQVMKVSPSTPTSSRRKSSASSKVDEDEFKVYIQPTILGRRVDPATRRIFPNIERLNVEPHSFSLTMALVTPTLLAKEEKQREEQAKRQEKDGVSPVKTTSCNKRPASTDRELPKTVEKKAKLTTDVKVSLPQQPVQPVTSANDTALVRLSSGKIVRVPLSLLKQHQAGIKARPAITQQPPSSTAANDSRLSQVLCRITPSSVIGSASLTTTTMSNGRISIPVSGTEQRVVKILANPGAIPTSINGAIAVSLPQHPVRLSTGLNTISRVSLDPKSKPIAIQQQAQTQQPQTVRIGLVNPSTSSSAVVATGTGQKLSIALNSLPRIQTQNPGAALTTSPNKVVVMGQRTLPVAANGTPIQVISASSAPSGVLSKVQLAPIFARKTTSVLANPPNSQGTPVTPVILQNGSGTGTIKVLLPQKPSKS